MRVALNFLAIDPAGRLSGIGNYCVKLLEHMHAINEQQGIGLEFDVYAQTGAEHHFPPHLRALLRPLPRIANRFHRVLLEQTSFALKLKRRKTDVLLNPAFTGPLWGARRNATVVHDLYFRTVPDLLGILQRLYLRFFVPLNCRLSWKVITDSESGAADLKRFYPKIGERVATIPLAGRFDPAPSASTDTPEIPAQPYVLMVANMTGNKNPQTVVSAVARLRSDGHDFRFVHVGSDPTNILGSVLDKFDAQGWAVKLRGVDDATLIAIYRNAHCLVVPSLYEGFGLPVLEGQQIGVPVLSSNSSCLPEVGGDGALYFHPTDDEALAGQIIALDRQPGLRAALIEAGLRNSRRYNWHRTAIETMRHLELLPRIGSPA